MLCIGSCAPLLIQQHIHLSGFNRSWNEYKYGFGDTKGNYWIGNDVISYLMTTNDNYTLRFDLQSRKNGKWYYAEYSTFVVLPEAHNYKLQVAGYSGNAGDDAMYVHNGQMFSTYDRNNDAAGPEHNCAADYGGGFWYNYCYDCGVNSSRKAINFNWWGLPGGRALQKSRMWLQCK